MTRKPRRHAAKGPNASRHDGHRDKGRKTRAAKKQTSAQTGAKTKEKADNSRGKAQPLSRGRLWVFRIATVILGPVLLLGAAELGLRIVGYGYPAGPTIQYRSNGQLDVADNNRFAWRFFPKKLAREFEPFVFAAKKPTGTYRVFVLGSSAAQGFPDASFCFGRVLQVMLENEYEGVHFEVITAAMSAVNSHVVRVVAEDLARFEPDMFIVYLGNNEVIGPYGLVSVFKPIGENLGLIRASIAMKRLKLGQLAGSLGGSELSEWHGMAMFSKRQVRANDKRLAGVYSNYRRNLEDIRDVGLRAGAKVVLCTVGSNLRDNPPFGSLHREGLSGEKLASWQQLYNEGVRLEEAGQYEQATSKYAEASDIDGEFANLHFRMGRCLWRQDEYVAAKDEFRLAREFDTLRFRADDHINETVRQVAGKGGDGVALVDCVEALADESPHGITGDELFWEHVHLNFKGNYVLARAVFEQVRKMLPEWVTKTAKGAEVASEQYCADALAYTKWDERDCTDETVNGFMRHAPFTGQIDHKKTVARLDRSLAELNKAMANGGLEAAAERYRAAIERNEGDWRLHYKYGKLLTEDMKDYSKAEVEFNTVIRMIGHSDLGYESLGTVLRAQGRLQEALKLYDKAAAIKPMDADIQYYLGAVNQRLGDMKRAETYYRRAIRLRPSYMLAYNHLGEVLFGQKQVDEAIGACRQGLAVDPNCAFLRSNLGVLLNARGDRQQALVELRRALELDPNSPGTKNALDTILKQQGAERN